MDSKEESLKLQSEFKDCQKVLTAIGDETRQYLIALMIMEKCNGARVIDIAKKQICHALRCLTTCKSLRMQDSYMHIKREQCYIIRSILIRMQSAS